MKFNGDLRAAAIIPDDPDILDDVKMEGFKHQVQLISHSCAFGKAMPDGRVLSEKIVLRARKIRVQDFHANPCEKHVHVSHCSVRNVRFTGLGEIMQNNAWELDVLQVTSESNFAEKDKPKNCACAVRLNRDLRQPRHSSSLSVREHAYVNTDVRQVQPRITCNAKLMSDKVNPDRRMDDKLCHGNQCGVVKRQ